MKQTKPIRFFPKSSFVTPVTLGQRARPDTEPRCLARKMHWYGCMELTEMQAVVAWAANAGRQEALMAKHEERGLEQAGIGLKQSFVAHFPTATADQAWILCATVYFETAKACQAFATGEW